MKILGVSAYYHDSAAALIEDGRIVAAAQEERFSRRKADSRFPANAIEYCLSAGGCAMDNVDSIVYYDKPFLTFERLIETQLAFAPWGFASFVASMPVWLKEKLFLKSILTKEFRSEFGVKVRGRLYFSEHHLSHAASAFFPSPFEEAAILTVDGVGEWATATIGHGQGSKIKLLREMRFPHSWGLFYSALTSYLGFKVNSGEYKVMGLAPFGDESSAEFREFYNKISSELLTSYSDGSVRLNMKYFQFATHQRTCHMERWRKLFGMPPRVPESPLNGAQANFALAGQRVLEEGLVRLAREARRLSGCKNLVMAGGVALNCVANRRIQAETGFENIWIQPAADDAGGALGAALGFYHLAEGRPRTVGVQDSMQGSYLGPSFTSDEIRQMLFNHGIDIAPLTNTDELCARVSEQIETGHVVGWFQGRMEWGPRALGHRSILASARDPEMQKKLNLSIKFRETFRPFAPSVKVESADQYFELKGSSPYMLLTAPVKATRLLPRPAEYVGFTLGEKLNTPRSDIPAVTHLDGSARVQTVDREQSPLYWQLLDTHERRTGCAVVINTSFNVRGEPIVATPEDAFRCFVMTEMDVLAVGDFLIERKNIPADRLRELRANFQKSHLFEKD